MRRIGSKTFIKITAFTIIALEIYATLILKQETHPMALSGAVASLFGINSAHEHIQTYLQQDVEK